MERPTEHQTGGKSNRNACDCVSHQTQIAAINYKSRNKREVTDKVRTVFETERTVDKRGFNFLLTLTALSTRYLV
jgi:hypothetical protein